MRIYYPINDEEPTPALPKGGSLNEAQYSLTSNRLTSNGRHPLSLGVIDGVASLVEERLRVLAHASEQSSSGRALLGQSTESLRLSKNGAGGGLPLPSSLEVAPQGIAD